MSNGPGTGAPSLPFGTGFRKVLKKTGRSGIKKTPLRAVDGLDGF